MHGFRVAAIAGFALGQTANFDNSYDILRVGLNVRF